MLRHAEQRIVGRTVPKHHEVASRIVQKHGTKGGNVVHVLNQECPPRHLRWSHVDAQAAAECLQLGRAVLCSFFLTEEQWKGFSAFFAKSPIAVLRELPCPGKDVLSGHGAVLLGQDQDMWKVQNSWGDDFGDGGFFMISKPLLLELEAQFYDIYFLEADLTAEDVVAYRSFCQQSNLRTVNCGWR